MSFGAEFYGKNYSKLDVEHYPFREVHRITVTTVAAFYSSQVYIAAFPHPNVDFDYIFLVPKAEGVWGGHVFTEAIGYWRSMINLSAYSGFPDRGLSRLGHIYSNVQGDCEVIFCTFGALPDRATDDFGVNLFSEDGSLIFSADANIVSPSYVSTRYQTRPLNSKEAISLTDQTNRVTGETFGNGSFSIRLAGSSAVHTGTGQRFVFTAWTVYYAHLGGGFEIWLNPEGSGGEYAQDVIYAEIRQ